MEVKKRRRWNNIWREEKDEIREGEIGEVENEVVKWNKGRFGNIGKKVLEEIRMMFGEEAQAVSGTLDPVLHPDCRGSQYHDPGGWGAISFSNGVRVFVDAPQTAKLPLLVRVVGSLGELTLATGKAGIKLWSGEERILPAPEVSVNSLELAVQDIVNCLTTGGEPAGTGEDGLAALEIIIGFHVSDRLRGQRVPLPLKGEDRDIEVLIG